MEILFSDKFYESNYASDVASTPGRLEAIMSVLATGYGFEIVCLQPASEEELRLAHTQTYLDKIKSNGVLYDMAKLAAGTAMAAADIALFEIIIADRVRHTAKGFWEALGFYDNKDGTWIYRI